MPRHDWFSDDTMSRDRSDMRESERRYGSNYENRDSGAMFGPERDRASFGRDSDWDRDNDRDRNRPIGGWGGLMSEDRDRYRDRDHDRGRYDERGEDRRYGADDYNRGVPMDETERLIASNKVEGTPVYDRHGDKLGSIHNFMVDKRKGKVVYAVLKHGGGFLGLNERYYPLDWDQLTYDTRLQGYHTRLEEEDLKGFGSFDSEGRWQSRGMGGRSDRDREHGRGYERSREPW